MSVSYKNKNININNDSNTNRKNNKENDKNLKIIWISKINLKKKESINKYSLSDSDT